MSKFKGLAKMAARGAAVQAQHNTASRSRSRLGTEDGVANVAFVEVDAFEERVQALDKQLEALKRRQDDADKAAAVVTAKLDLCQSLEAAESQGSKFQKRLEELANVVDTNIVSTTSKLETLEADLKKQAVDRAAEVGQLTKHCASLDGEIEAAKSRSEAETKARIALQGDLTTRIEKDVSSEKERTDALVSTAMSQRATQEDEIRATLSAEVEKLAKAVAEVAQRFRQALEDEHVGRVESHSELKQATDLLITETKAEGTSAAELLTRRLYAQNKELEARLSTMQQDNVSYQASMAETVNGLQSMDRDIKRALDFAESYWSKRAEWRVKIGAQDTEPKAIWSPTFDAAGLRDCQLQVQVDPRRETCHCSFWCPGSSRVTFTIYVQLHGSESRTFKRFTAVVMKRAGSAGTMEVPVSQMHQAVGFVVGVEILECQHVMWRELQELKNSGSKPEQQLESRSLRIRRQVSHNLNERLHEEILKQKRRLTRRVEWRVPKLSHKLATFPRGTAIRSPFFDAAGIEGFQFMFYPNGTEQSDERMCGLFLVSPIGSELNCALHVGTAQRGLRHKFDNKTPTGRANFCILQQCADFKSDSVVIALDIQEARMDSFLAPDMDDRTPGDEAVAPTVIPGETSVIRLNQAANVPSLFEVQLLPDAEETPDPGPFLSLFGAVDKWTAKQAGKMKKVKSAAGLGAPTRLERPGGASLEALPRIVGPV
mmetsp:Transcript_28117/g.59785  ORF Transcript_28117/g.59785 Transcript_28117/m.59785 type:complete len:715 (-) Transcript_28117:28-2172(-)